VRGLQVAKGDVDVNNISVTGLRQELEKGGRDAKKECKKKGSENTSQEKKKGMQWGTQNKYPNYRLVSLKTF